MKSLIFKSLLMIAVVMAAYWPMRALPDRHLLPAVSVPLQIRPVELRTPAAPLRLAGAWELDALDSRFGGISALAIDRGRFLAVTDRGAVLRFDFPNVPRPRADLADLRDGPGPFGKKWARDAESLAADPRGRGWWIGYEQNHSLWLYDGSFNRAFASIELDMRDWRDNRGAEGLLVEDGNLLVTAENGRDALRVGRQGVERLALEAGAGVAEAAKAPDGSRWLLLRSKGTGGIEQSIAPLLRTGAGYHAGPGWLLPKGVFDNYEGMAIEARRGGGWRFWLISDDGHRIMARTLLVALDYVPPIHNKSPATRAGPLRKPLGNAP